MSKDVKATTALGVVCDSCEDVVFPEHRETVEEMHNTECSACESGLLRMKTMEVARTSEIEEFLKDVFEQLVEEQPKHGRVKYGNRAQEFLRNIRGILLMELEEAGFGQKEGENAGN